MADYRITRNLVDDLRKRVKKLEARIEALEEDDSLFDIPIECDIDDCGLVCNTEEEYAQHVRKEHPKQA